MLHLDAARFVHYYSMQEINLRMPKCLGAATTCLPAWCC